MKNILFFILMCSTRILSEDIKWSVTSSIWSQYLARPGFILYDGPTLQNDITGTWKGLYSGLWSSTGLGESDVLRQEYQPYLGYRTKSLGILFDCNVRYDAFNDIVSSRDDLWMVDIRAELSGLPYIQPYFATRHFHSVSGRDELDGWFFWIGLRHVEKTKLASIVFDTSVAYCDDVLNREGGWVYERSVLQIAFPVTKRITLTPQVTIQVPLSATDFTSKFVIVGGLSLNYKF